MNVCSRTPGQASLLEPLEPRLLLDGGQDLTIQVALPQSQGYYYTADGTANVSGLADTATTAKVLVRGAEADYSLLDGSWSAGIGGRTLVAGDDAATYHVPTAGEDPLAWNALGYDDSLWTSEIAEGQAGLLITEVGTGDTDWVEVQNVSAAAIDTAGWVVLANDPSGGASGVVATAWTLPASVAAGQVLYQTDDVADHYWGADIPWSAAGSGWVMVLDGAGGVMDFAAWGYTAAEIASLSIDYGAFTGITAAGAWTGDGAEPGTTGGGPPIPGWVAFNDHVRDTGTHANATSYAANGTASGALKDIATGSPVPVTLATSGSGIHYGGNGAAPAPGTDAATVFDGFVDFTTGTEASIEIEAANGDSYTHAFTGLDAGPAVTYNFTGTAVRGEEGGYADRWTLVTLVGADAATAAHSTGDGVVVVSGTQVAIWTGQNHEADQGFVAAWTGIDPGIDGAFSVVSTQYTGATPGVGSGTADGTKGYGLAGIRLEEVGPTGPLSFLVRSGDHDNDGAGDFARSTEGTKGLENPGMTVPFGTITPVAMGLGFSGGHFDDYVRTDVAGDMLGTNASLWTRVEFQAPDLAAYDTLTLRVRYDDGFFAYLNGAKIAGANAPGSPAWNSAATAEHPDGQAASYESIDVSAHLGDLFVGDNVLAIHGLNLAAGDADFLVQAELIATSGVPGAGLTLQPGINRILVQALDPSGAEIDRTRADIWYDTGATNNQSGTLPPGTTTWAAADGPYRVTGNITVPGGSVLVIEPGTTVFFDSGRRITVNGQLFARGTETERLHLTRTPGTGSDWDGLSFSGTDDVCTVAYADLEYADGTNEAVYGSNAEIHLDHVVFEHFNGQYVNLHSTSIRATNCVFPDVSGIEPHHFSGFPAGGYAYFAYNWFGGTSGYNDIFDFTGGNRPGPIARFYNNVFVNGGDDVLDLDGTDAHIEGNVFWNIHQDASRSSKSYCVTTGAGGGGNSELTVVRNLFIDVDHALLSKQDGFLTVVGNTIVNVHKDPAVSGATTAVINFWEDRSGQWPGLGAYFDGNIIYDASALWENLNADGTTTSLETHRNILWDVDAPYPPLPGTGNVVADPLFTGYPAPTPVVEPIYPLEIYSPALWDLFDLRPGSPASGAGFNGVDAGARIPPGATVAGEPPPITSDNHATLTVGGPDIYGYKYRVEKDGAWLGDWSAEVPHPAPNPPDAPIPPIPPIVLTGLQAGTYAVHVIRQDSAGFWQSEDEATRSRAWTVTGPRVMGVSLNNRPGRTLGDIEPSGIGVRTIDVAFSENVTLAPGAVTVETVAFPGGVETVTGTPAATVGRPTGHTLRIGLGDPVGAVDTWVKVTLSAADITDADTNALDGDPWSDSSGLGYLYDAEADLPSGDGTPGGDAVFYVGSLRADLRGFGPLAADPNGTVDSWDITGFTQKYLAGNLDADFRGFGPIAEEPDGNVDSWDINGFTSRYVAAIAAGTHLDDLPTSGGGLAVGAPAPLPLVAATGAAPDLTDAPEVDLLLESATPEVNLLAESATRQGVARLARPAVRDPSAVAPAGGFEAALTLEAAAVSADSAAWSPTASDTAAAGGLAADTLLDPLALPALNVQL